MKRVLSLIKIFPFVTEPSFKSERETRSCWGTGSEAFFTRSSSCRSSGVSYWSVEPFGSRPNNKHPEHSYGELNFAFQDKLDNPTLPNFLGSKSEVDGNMPAAGNNPDDNYEIQDAAKAPAEEVYFLKGTPSFFSREHRRFFPFSMWSRIKGTERFGFQRV